MELQGIFLFRPSNDNSEGRLPDSALPAAEWNSIFELLLKQFLYSLSIYLFRDLDCF